MNKHFCRSKRENNMHIYISVKTFFQMEQLRFIKNAKFIRFFCKCILEARRGGTCQTVLCTDHFFRCRASFFNISNASFISFHLSSGNPSVFFAAQFIPLAFCKEKAGAKSAVVFVHCFYPQNNSPMLERV